MQDDWGRRLEEDVGKIGNQVTPLIPWCIGGELQLRGAGAKVRLEVLSALDRPEGILPDSVF